MVYYGVLIVICDDNGKVLSGLVLQVIVLPGIFRYSYSTKRAVRCVNQKKRSVAICIPLFYPGQVSIPHMI